MRFNRRYLSTCLTLAALLGLTACSADVGKGEESDVPEDGKYDSIRRPTERGRFGVGEIVSGIISEGARFHAWEFSVDGQSKITLTTEAAGGANPTEVDTVLYLYKQDDDYNWGRYIARNDDVDGSPFSSISQVLENGTYRVLVKGHGASDLGAFLLSSVCEGTGCREPSPPEPACLFTSEWGNLDHLPYFSQVSEASFSVEGERPQGIVADQLLAVIQAVGYDEVRTIDDVFESVDDGEVYLSELRDARTGRSYHAFLFYGGENPNGGITPADSTTVIALNGDGSIGDCTELEPADLWNDIALAPAPAPRALSVFRAVHAGQLSGIPQGGDLPESQRSRIFELARTTVGDACDGMPEEATYYLSNTDADSMVGFLTSEYSTPGWVDAATSEQVDALKAFFVPYTNEYEQEVFDEAETFEVFELDIVQRRGCEAMEGKVFLVHNRDTHAFFYVTLRKY